LTDVTRNICAFCIPDPLDWPAPLADEPLPVPLAEPAALPEPVPLAEPVPLPPVAEDPEPPPEPIRLPLCNVPRISTWLFRYFFNSA
jgi:hypothetical protein